MNIELYKHNGKKYVEFFLSNVKTVFIASLK